MDFIKEQTQKAVGETIEKEWKKYTSTPAVREKQKTENKNGVILQKITPYKVL